MARYRFNWENLPRPLISELGKELRISGSPVVSSLRARYGARPKPSFVTDTWPVLLDSWLSVDDKALRAVVDQLRTRRLGDWDGPVETTEERLSYLRSCRNSTSLREVVVAELIRAGEADQVPLPTAKAAPPDSPPPRIESAMDREHGGEQETLEQFVDHTLRAFLGVDQLERDEDGDIPIRSGSSMCYVRVIDADEAPSRVRFICPLIGSAKKSFELFESLNEINRQLILGRVVLDAEQVILEGEILANSLIAEELIWALETMAATADYFDSRLSARYGGNTSFADDDSNSVDV